jgi:multidrug efflux pump subunit AcrB
MIGFLALAGIIVRNSILLVDFIRHGARQGKPLRAVLLEAGAVRFKPILLTALAAMIGAATILPDPIFQGLAIWPRFLDAAHYACDSGDLHRVAR